MKASVTVRGLTLIRATDFYFVCKLGSREVRLPRSYVTLLKPDPENQIRFEMPGWIAVQYGLPAAAA